MRNKLSKISIYETPIGVEILRSAADVILIPGLWTQGAGFRDEFGDETDKPNKACQFCVVAAIDYAEISVLKTHKIKPEKYNYLPEDLQAKLVQFNDHRNAIQTDIADYLYTLADLLEEGFDIIN